MADRLSDIQALVSQYSELSDSRNEDILEYVKLNQELNRTLLTNEKELQQNIQVLRKASALSSIEEEIKAAKKRGESTVELEARAAEERERIAKVAAKAAENKYLEEYKKASISKKIEMQREKAATLKSAADSARAEYDLKIEYAKEAGDTILQQELENKKQQELASIEAAQKEAEVRLGALDAAQQKSKGGKPSPADKRKDDFEKKLEKASNKVSEAATRYEEAVISGSEEEKAAAEQELENALKEKENLEEQKELAEAQKAAANKMAAFVGSAIQDALNLITEYKGAMDSRLQGSEKSYTDIVDKATTMLSVNPFVESKKVVDAMKKATEQGIVYNIEQRSFLWEISNKIADTFDAFDSNLSRLIRIQQADSTAARLGMEATLTKVFNRMFEDNSYLSDKYDDVAAALLEGSATMTNEIAAEFEFTAQKWLGALYSLGLSGDTVTQIAQGLSYIATGDVTSMASNTQMQTLFAMAASKAGEDYAQLFVEGLDASKTNNLLGSIVGYIKEIALNSNNNVVRSAYGDIFNVSMSDLKAISNITQEEIQSLSELTYDYSALLQETTNQLSFGNLMKRSNLGAMMETVYRNATFGMGMDMASNPATFALYKLTSYMNQENLEMAIPFLNAMGFGLDLNTNIEDIMKLGLGLAGAMSIGANIFSGLAQGGGFSLGSWDASKTTHRGGSLAFTTDSGTVDTGAVYTGNSSSDDMKNSSLRDATKDAEETGEITNKNSKTEYVFDDFYKAVIIGTPQDRWLRSYDYSIHQVYDTGAHYLSVRDARMQFSRDALKVEDAQFKFTNDKALVTEDKNSTLGLSELRNINQRLSEIKLSVSGITGPASPLTALVTQLMPKDSLEEEQRSLTEMSGPELELIISQAVQSAIRTIKDYYG